MSAIIDVMHILPILDTKNRLNVYYTYLPLQKRNHYQEGICVRASHISHHTHTRCEYVLQRFHLLHLFTFYDGLCALYIFKEKQENICNFNASFMITCNITHCLSSVTLRRSYMCYSVQRYVNLPKTLLKIAPRPYVSHNENMKTETM